MKYLIRDFMMRLQDNFFKFFGIFAFFILWEILPGAGVLRSDFFPPISKVVSEIVTDASSGILLQALGYSFLHYFLGLGCAVITAISIGILIGRINLFDCLLNPIIELLRPIPPIAWIPAAILWLGLTPQACAFVIFIGTFFPILINTYDGIKGVEKTYIEAALSLGTKKETTMIRKVILPAASPNIFTGIRISISAGWMCLVGAEMFGAGKGGLGLNLWNAYGYQNMAGVFAYMLILGIIGLLMNWLFRKYEDYYLKWRKGVVV